MEEHKALLERFLSVPLSSADDIFKMFAALPGAKYGRGKRPQQQYVYVPGKRKDRVVLVAHADTVWDREFGVEAEQKLIFEEGEFRSASPNAGIGADDRAGCAMVWALRDSGHSLLILDGEERGRVGARYLKTHAPLLFNILNAHRYMIELDWCSTGVCLYNKVDNTEEFKNYIAQELDFNDHKTKGNCDLLVLCRDICGVNLGIGYYCIHRPGERLILSEWEKTYQAVRTHLEKPQKRFPIPMKVRMRKFLRAAGALPGRALRKAKRIIWKR